MSQNDDTENTTPPPPVRTAAVALKDTGAIPKVIASGYGKLAEDIVALALASGIKVREDKELAQMLASLETESDIPSEALIAVAEILAYVYKANATYKPEEDESPPHVP